MNAFIPIVHYYYLNFKTLSSRCFIYFLAIPNNVMIVYAMLIFRDYVNEVYVGKGKINQTNSHLNLTTEIFCSVFVHS